ncbi:MAG TPA: mandelate racemase/muconate lactonizing enzyme family protein [Roseiflexaceae bacterium]|nr:mandelate racemase/muconate lactonizing enzyme family protein [Roseiflexaceae bacterium]
MKITDVKTVLLTGPCTADPFLLEARRLRSAALIEIHTDGGVIGIGESYAGYFCPELVAVAVEYYRPILLGIDILKTDIHTLWRRMYLCENFWGRVGLGPAVLSGIEAALWDLKGKLLGLPVYELLGGRCHERLPAYATGGPSNWPPDKLKAKIDFYLSLGFRAFKVGAGYYDSATGMAVPARSTSAIVEMEAGKAQLLREYVGADIAVLMDGHMGNPLGDAWDLPTARAVLQALEPYDLFFFEEPLPYTDPWGYAELRRATSVPIAGGECLTTLTEFRQYADLDALTIAQPDAAWIGGLGEFVRVARMFDARGRRIATHSWGAGVAQMQNIHAGFASPNTIILELPPAAGALHTELWGDSLIMRDGYIYPPEQPGLGVRLTDAIKEKFPFVPGSGEFNSVPGKILKD